MNLSIRRLQRFDTENPAQHQHTVGDGAQRLLATDATDAGRLYVTEELYCWDGAYLSFAIVRRLRRHGRVPTLRGPHMRRMQR